jgi:site-specific DNA recombinase
MKANGSQNKRNNGRRNSHEAPTAIRCAIYTRKSTEDGLDSGFSSLDAQYEAAQAYIASQKQEGWICLPDHYDDGGFTGGNMDRPALKRLLTDVKIGKIDCVVVYKLDRLSRSLIDFVRIIDVLENHNACFVSITQQFNSSTSMGRLTLNILLSFAQFEREIIAERTRDKMCAARRRGKWTGGIPMLGYDIDPKGGRLIVNRSEAERVREIFTLYLQQRSLLKVVQELSTRSWTTKSWIRKNGSRRQGKPFTKTNLHNLLTNPIYLGKVKLHGDIYDGEHEAIVKEPLWNQVQQILKNNRRTAERLRANKHGVLLQGLVRCAHCKTTMFHSFTQKGNRRYRYYVCSSAQKKGYETCPSRSVPAAEMEKFVVERIREIGNDHALLKLC